MGTKIKDPLQNTSEKDLQSHGIVATLCDESQFHLVFNQRLDADMQPELEDFSLFAGGQRIELVSLSLKSGIKEGEPWSLITFGLLRSIPPGTAFQINYHPRQFFLWSEEREEPIEGFELRAIVADLSVLRALDLKVEPSAGSKDAPVALIKVDAHIIEACEQQVRIELKHILDTEFSPKTEDFRAQSDTGYLNIDRAYITPSSAGAELNLLLHQEIEPGSKVKVTYKSGRRSLRSQNGEYLENFQVDAIANEHRLEDSANREKFSPTLEDIDRLLEVAKHGLVATPKEESMPVEMSDTTKSNSHTKEDIQHSGSQGDAQAAEHATEASKPKEAFKHPEESNVVPLFGEPREQASSPCAPEPSKPSTQHVKKALRDETQTPLASSPAMEKPSTKRVAKHLPSQPATPQAVEIAPAKAHDNEQKLEPANVDLAAKTQRKRSLREALSSATPITVLGITIGATLIGWALFAILNFFSLVFSIGSVNEPQANLIEKIAPKNSGALRNNSTAIKGNARQPCEKTYDDGAHFKGSCANGKRDGGGKHHYANGDSYSGEWLEDQPHGNGMVQKANGEIYAGGFAHNKKQGKGSYSWPNGKVYEGEFLNDEFHGQGVLKEVDGRRFEGRFENGRPTEGICISPDGIKIRGPC